MFYIKSISNQFYILYILKVVLNMKTKRAKRITDAIINSQFSVDIIKFVFSENRESSLNTNNKVSTKL